MKDTTVAARYAKALFLVTERRKETPRALEDLKALAAVLARPSRVWQLLATPQLRLADKRKVVRETLDKRCVRSVALFLDLLLRKQRLTELATIAVEFESLVERAQGIQRARVSSAVALTAGEQKRLHQVLEKSTGKKIRLTAEVDPELIGGAQVRIGDRVVDRSVRALLDAIRSQLEEVSV